jgi:tRNA-specific 2-thiouridylase
MQISRLNPILQPADAPRRGARVTVGLSGGVDSSVAALLLQRQGFAVSGVFMKNWQEQDPLYTCTAADDANDARQVCQTLGIEFNGINFSGEYWQRVFQHFLTEYAQGRTPNPDILCNKEIKFRVFLDHALAQGADHIATGHYARVSEENGRRVLMTGADADKDQSYFLYTLGQEQLAKVIFPLGGLKKSQVRSLAAAAGFANHGKKDSTGVCFIGERNFRKFLRYYFNANPGTMRTTGGDVVGEHDGLMFYTIGQRQGLGIGGKQHSDGRPWYVAGKDPVNNTLIVVQGRDHPALFTSTLTAEHLHWVAGTPPPAPFRCQAKTRYRQTAQSCEIVALEDGRCRVRFDSPQWAVTPGQAVVFYRGERCLGGGTIDAAVDFLA